MNTRSLRGEVATGILIGVAVVAVAALVSDKVFNRGEMKRAKESAKATAKLVETIDTVDQTREAQAAAAAASVVKIGEAAKDLPPDSRPADFIHKEVPLALSYLPQPDPKALLEAEKRRVAVMEGKLTETKRLYEAAYKEAGAAKEAVAKAEAQRDQAIEARRAADTAITVAAEVNRALAMRSFWQWLGLGVLAVVALYLWLTGVSPRTIGRALASVRSGEETAVQAFDRLLPDWMHKRVQNAARLETPLAEEPAKPLKTTAAKAIRAPAKAGASGNSPVTV